MLPPGRTIQTFREFNTGHFTDETLLNMSFEYPQALDKPLGSVAAIAGNFGCHPKTVRRARAVVANALLAIQDYHVVQAAREAPPAIMKAFKFGWDEATLRMVCPPRQARDLFPSLGFAEADEVTRQKN